MAISASATSLEATLQPRSIDNRIKLKILPLGASIVWGTDSSDHNGFREHLRDLLEANHGNDVSFVGTRFHGNMTNNACEAYPGDTIGEVVNKSMSSGAFDYLPNVILIHLGTNDCMPYLNITTSAAAAKFADLLRAIKSKDPAALVVASTLIKNLDLAVEERIVKLNALLPTIVTQAKNGGQNVTLVDMHDAVLTGVETRTSSPVKITRGEDLQSLNIKGLYPAGEGASYAGGILSAGVDGIEVAEAVAISITKPR